MNTSPHLLNGRCSSPHLETGQSLRHPLLAGSCPLPPQSSRSHFPIASAATTTRRSSARHRPFHQPALLRQILRTSAVGMVEAPCVKTSNTKQIRLPFAFPGNTEQTLCLFVFISSSCILYKTKVFEENKTISFWCHFGTIVRSFSHHVFFGSSGPSLAQVFFNFPIVFLFSTIVYSYSAMFQRILRKVILAHSFTNTVRSYHGQSSSSLASIEL